MYFNLKDKNSEKPTLIMLVYFLKSENKRFKYSTTKKILPGDWNAAAKMPLIKKGRTDLKILSSYLSKYSNFLNKVLSNAELKNEIVDRQYLKDCFNLEFKNQKRSAASHFLTDYFAEFVESKKSEKKYTALSIQKYNNLKSVLIEFETLNKTRLRFSSIDDSFFSSYCGFLRDVKNYQDNTLARHVTFLKTYLNWCSRSGINANMKYKDFSSPTRESDHIALTQKELKRIENLKLDSKELTQARDLFLIGCYSGQRFSDFSVFNKSDINDGMIIRDSKKMKQKSYIPLHPKLKAVLELYDWNIPKLSAYEFIPLIRIVCAKAGMNEDFKRIEYRGNKKEVIIKPRYEMVGSHTCRRTFITISAEKGVPHHIIMAISGIKDIKTLHRYIKVNKDEINKSINDLW